MQMHYFLVNVRSLRKGQTAVKEQRSRQPGFRYWLTLGNSEHKGIRRAGVVRDPDPSLCPYRLRSSAIPIPLSSWAQHLLLLAPKPFCLRLLFCGLGHVRDNIAIVIGADVKVSRLALSKRGCRHSHDHRRHNRRHR